MRLVIEFGFVLTALSDYEMPTEPGSINPFIPGNARNTSPRFYGFYVVKNNVDITVLEVGPGESEVIWEASPDLKAHGYVMYPMLKLGLNNAFGGLLGELKAYAEGRPAAAA